MSKEKLDDYELFYVEIPSQDYLDNILGQEIQDDHEPEDANASGLSNDQVSQIATDQLNEIQQSSPAVTHDPNGLFGSDQQSAA